MNSAPTGWELDCIKFRRILRWLKCSGIEKGIQGYRLRNYFVLYAMCIDGKVFYFGISENLEQRILQHFGPDLTGKPNPFREWKARNRKRIDLVVLHKEPLATDYEVVMDNQTRRMKKRENIFIWLGKEKNKIYNVKFSGCYRPGIRYYDVKNAANSSEL